jgi:hypothetical protein
MSKEITVTICFSYFLTAKGVMFYAERTIRRLQAKLEEEME